MENVVCSCAICGQVGDTWWKKELCCAHNKKEVGQKGEDCLCIEHEEGI
jgi:hypothetical protein